MYDTYRRTDASIRRCSKGPCCSHALEHTASHSPRRCRSSFRHKQDRAATRDAVTRAVEESALHSIKAMQHVTRLHEERREERLEAMTANTDKKKSFNQKVRRPRRSLV